MGRGPVVIAIWFMDRSGIGIGIAGWVFLAGERRRGNKDRVRGIPGKPVGWADVTRIHPPAPAKDWTNEGTHTRLNPPHKGPLHIPPAHCTTVAARAVLLDTRTTKAVRKV